jgi:arylsulfatase A-like enzyme
VFAGFLEHTDHEIGRFKKALEDIGELDNTLFIYIARDNGTSSATAPSITMAGLPAPSTARHGRQLTCCR